MATPGQQTELNLGQFSGVDASGSVQSFLVELDRRDRLPWAMAIRKRLYELLEASPGDRIVDVGCGPGKVVAELMERGINVVGIDLSEQVLSRARSRFPAGDFRLASANALPFEAGELGGYVALLLYQHIPDPAPSLTEARRVLASGGRLVLADVENDLWAVDSDEQTVVRRMLPAFADSVANPWVGRRFPVA